MAERFIVRFRPSAAGKEITARLHADPRIDVLDESPNMVLVEALESQLVGVVRPGADVMIVPERHYERPDTRPSLAPPAKPKRPSKTK